MSLVEALPSYKVADEIMIPAKWIAWLTPFGPTKAAAPGWMYPCTCTPGCVIATRLPKDTGAAARLFWHLPRDHT